MRLFDRSILFGFLFLFILSACSGGGGDDDDDAVDDGNVITDVTVIGASSSALARVILPGPECVNGGVQIDTGIDDNGNGILDPAEVDSTEIICNGAVGADGVTSLVEQTEVQPGLVCAAGGVRFDAGRDENANGVLDGFEITSSEFLCSDGLFGVTGAGSPVVVSAISISNTEVLVQFSEPMAIDAENPVHYSIATEDKDTRLPVWDAIFASADSATVKLSTFSQSAVGYELTVANLRDLDGNPIADPTILIDPSKTNFVGTEPSGPTLADSDGDTLPDHVELIGWDVTITYGNGTTETRRVTSDPGNPTLPVDDPVNVAARDTDGEGVTDNEERHGNMDPRQPDTDGDVLTDNQEWNIIYSSPTQQDTDGDGTEDGFEFYSYRTSPVLADTDGDQINDTEEVLLRNRDPRIADLPRWDFEIGDIRLQIDERFTFEDATGQTVTTDSSSSVTLTSGSNESIETVSTKALEKVWSVNGGVEANFGNNVLSTQQPQFPIVSLFLNGGHERTEAEIDTVTETSALESQRVHANSIAKATELSSSGTVLREVVDARIDADITIQNRGNLAFAISNLEITVMQRSRESTRRFVPVATLVANSTLMTGTPTVFNLGPFTPERGPILFGSSNVFPDLVEELMQAPPGALIYEVANFDITDEYGRVFSFTSQAARDRTAGVVVDKGDGELRRHLVATALQPDMDGLFGAAGGFIGGFNGDGSPKGIPLDFALRDILGLTKNAAEVDSILAGEDGVAQSIAQGDDVQRIPPQTTGLDSGSIVVSAGPNGVLDTPLEGDDVQEVGTGYETSLTCGVDSGTDVGKLCSNDLDCQSGGIIGTCSGPEILVRFENLRNGDFNRQWVVLTSGQIPAGGDFDQLVLKPGEDILFAFVQDLDGDGIFAREELLAGSTDSDADSLNNSTFGVVVPIEEPPGSGEITGYTLSPPVAGVDGIPDSMDTDRDGLGDFTEVRIGSTVSADGGILQRVFPSPRLADSDGDKLLDPQEKNLRDFCEVPGVIETRTDALCAYLNDPVVQRLDAIAIIAGPDGRVDTNVFVGDDVQLVQGFTSGLDPDTRVIEPGPNGIIDTPLNNIAGPGGGDDEYVSLESSTRTPPSTNPVAPDTDADGLDDFRELHAFLAGTSIRDRTPPLEYIGPGPDGILGSFPSPSSDDVAEVPPGTGGLARDFIAISAGPNGVIDSTAFPDDEIILQEQIGIAETRAIGDDIQQAFFGAPVLSGGIVVLPGANGTIDSCGPAPSENTLCGGGNDLYTAGVAVVTDPLRRDTDGDLVADGIELANGGNPVDPADGGDFRDSDQDGLSDVEESSLGWLVASNGGIPRLVLSNPSRPDSDFDGLPDFAERELRTDPNNSDTDGDGLSDFDEFANFERFFGLDSQFPGFSVDGASSLQYGSDPLLADTDGDTLSDYQELVEGYRVLFAGELAPRTILTNPRVTDTDLDGRSDAEERGASFINTGPDTIVDTLAIGDDIQVLPFRCSCGSFAVAVTAGANGILDTTPDGNDQIVEVFTTDATNPDTDGDGRSDGVETDPAIDTNPLVPDIGVTVTFGDLLVDRVIDLGVSGNADLIWLLTVKTPEDPPVGNGRLVSSTSDIDPNLLGAPPLIQVSGTNCFVLDAPNNPLTALSLRLNQSRTFALQQGETFTVKGMIWEYDGVSLDCGTIPYYLPTFINSGCVTRFSETYSFDDLVNGGQVDFPDPFADPSNTDSECEWTLDVNVEAR